MLAYDIMEPFIVPYLLDESALKLEDLKSYHAETCAKLFKH